MLCDTADDSITVEWSHWAAVHENYRYDEAELDILSL